MPGPYPTQLHMLVGTYTHLSSATSHSKGVYLYSVDIANATARQLHCAQVPNPSFLSIQGSNVYALSEMGTHSQLHSIALHVPAASQQQGQVPTASQQQGQVATMAGQQASIQGQVPAASQQQGQVASIVGQQAPLQGHVPAASQQQGQVAAMASQQASIQGQVPAAAVAGVHELTLTATIPSPGDDPCHLMAVGDKLYTACYSSGSVAVIQLNSDGTLGETKQQFHFTQHGSHPRQQASHLHNLALSPCGTYLVASNLGGDCLHLFKRHKSGLLSPLQTVSTPAESGPRHMQWDNSGTHLYLITELSDEVMVFTFEQERLNHVQTINAARTPSHGAGDIHIHPSGKWLYASARLIDDGIALFSIPADDAPITRTAFFPTGKHPRNFAITPCGTMLLCACSHKKAIEFYSIAPDDGSLTYLEGHDIPIDYPVCLVLF